MQYTFRFRESIGEIVGGLLLIALGTVWAVTSIGYGLIGEGGRLAPGTVPFSAGTVLALCGVVIAIKGVLTSRVPVGTPGSEVAGESVAVAVDSAAVTPAARLGGPQPETRRERLLALPREHPVLSVYLLIAFGVLLMPIIGFSVAFALAIFSILRFVERQRVLLAATVAVVTALFGFILFEVVFNLPLPEPFFL